jgi:hypothetical protein
MRLSVATIAVALIAAACSSATSAGTSKVSLAPHTKLPLFQVAIEDPGEAAIIMQQLKIAPVLVEAHTMYFVDSAGAAKRLSEAGYELKPASAVQIETRIVHVPIHGAETELLSTGVTLINREKDYWVISGTLAQLALLPRLGYSLEPMGDEPRPRSVRVTVASSADVQAVNAMGVDIYATMAAKEPKGAIVILCGAFDSQIDAMEKAGYKVVRDPSSNSK